MYINTKVNRQTIKLILDSKSADSIIIQQFIDQLDYRVDYTANAKIIIADGVTKTPISEIDDFLFEAYAVVMTRNTRQQLSSIAAHVLLNALKDQNKLENGIISHAWLVEKLFSTKEYETTFLRKEEHMLPEDKQSNTWTDVYMIMKKFDKWLSPKLKKYYQKK
ncbi:hypothetical protein G9A89_017042 [Geosiphon pyriformis]|nr:hypothetical protein G9A89_017042 [Geosiphon pyriformis]